MVAAGLLFLSILPLSLANSNGLRARERHRMFVRDQNLLKGFSPSGIDPPLDDIFQLTLALRPSNMTGLHNSLLDVSDPSSPNYGNHLSKTEVESLVAPRPESVKAVTDWLAKHNITAEVASASGDMLRINVPLQAANSLLDANYATFIHTETNTTLIRTLAYSVPADVQQHLAFVYPTTQFIPPIARTPSFQFSKMPKRSGITRSGRRSTVPPSCAQTITPQCLQALYNIPAMPATAASNSLGVSGFLNEVANTTDLQQFLAQQRPDITNGTFGIQSVDGGADDGPGTLEASLDIQYTVGLATNVPTTFISVGSQTQDGVDGFLDIINSLLQEANPPSVLTTSFGFDEDGLQQAPEVAQTLCNAYAQLGARGTSILFSSGDGGVAGNRPSDTCDNGFVPTFPSGCPFVTSVGSTQDINPETAAPFSAGGFSNIFPRPAYQDAAVETYLASLGNTNAGLFNISGRGYPDVSTQGNNFVINVGGESQFVFGTSASSPTFASVVALLNDALLNTGKSPLGFLNPLLYSNASAALNDITSGCNPSCGTSGFPAAAGWDPVTGLGTPDFDKLRILVTGSG